MAGRRRDSSPKQASPGRMVLSRKGGGKAKGSYTGTQPIPRIRGRALHLQLMHVVHVADTAKYALAVLVAWLQQGLSEQDNRPGERGERQPSPFQINSLPR